MINVDKIDIPFDSNLLYLKVSIEDSTYFTNVYLGTIKIYTQDNLETPIKTVTIPSTATDRKNYEHYFTEAELSKSVHSNFFVVTIESSIDSIPSADTPCGSDICKVTTAVFDKCPFYKDMIQNMKELESECNIPKYFVDSLLQYKAIKIAIETGNIDKAISLYKKFFTNKSVKTVKSCGCNG